jgi:hypothetical protein
VLQRDGRVEVGAHLHASERFRLGRREVQPDRAVRDLGIRTVQRE